PIREIVTAPGFEAAAERIVAQVRSGAAWSGEFLVRRKDGTAFPAFVVLSPISRHGQPIGLVSVSRNISAEKNAEDELRRSESRQRALLSAIPDLVFHLTASGRYIDYFGPENATYVPREAFIGQRIEDALPLPLAETFKKAIHQAV